VAAAFNLDRALRRYKPDKRFAILRRRDEGELPYVDREELIGSPLLLDTCVYLHVLRGKTPQKVDSLLEGRLVFHSATAIGELTHRFGARLPMNQKEKAAREKLAVAIRRIPAHRVVAPTVAIWGEAGILAGLRARVGGFSQLANQSTLNDALLFLQALVIGAVVLTENVGDYDIFHQMHPNGRALYYRALPHV
jgi:predicted nucleic acid-binding protein